MRSAAAFPLRRITAADVPAMSRNVAAGIASYAAWAPAGWQPEPAASAPEGIRARMETPGFYGWITAEESAHVAAHPATEEPGTVHLMHLFVAPARQGTGVAAALLDRAIATARAQGATAMRLRTPRGNARGLAFYRREGWGEESDAGDGAGMGLPLLWLRRPL